MSLLTEGSGTGQSAGKQTQGTGNPNEGAHVNTTTPAQGTGSWRDSLPDDLKSHGGLAQFNDVQSLAKSYVHAQSLIGKKGVVVPGEKASPEEMEAFFDSIGRPALDKYDISVEGIEANFLKEFKEQAHKSGVLPKQAKELLEKYKAYSEASQAAKKAADAAAEKEALEGLRKEWGQGYDKEVAYAKAAVSEIGPEFAEYLEKTGRGNDTNIIKGLAKLGRFLGEDRLRGMDNSSFGQTPAELQNEINSIMGNPLHPYFDSAHPGHKNAVNTVSSLYQKLSSKK